MSSSRIYIGIDLGADGAFVAINGEGKILHVMKMPTITDSQGTRQIDSFQAYSWLYENYDTYDEEVLVYTEKLHAIFGTSAGSNFQFAKNIGKTLGVVECLQLPCFEVPARTWQKHIFEQANVPEITILKKRRKKPSRDTKRMALDAALKIFGDQIAEYRAHDGVVDAALIAYYAKETHK